MPFKDIEENELLKKIKEISDYKYALDEASIIAITNQKGIITHVNDNFCKISKYSREELIGQDHRIINSDYHPKSYIKELWSTIAKGNVWKGELRNKAKDGTYYWVDTTIVPFLNQEEKPYQYVAIRSDITERKKGEEVIKHMLETTEYQNKQLVDFCNIVSHNLRAPLVNISMLLNFLEESQDDEDRTELLKRAKPVVNHLNEIFNELVESLQIRQDSEIQSINVDLKDCVEKILISFDAQIKSYNATITTNFDEVPILYYPHKYIESILTNLISNAIKYKSPDKNLKLEIKTKIVGKHIVLSVKDNGLGIDLNRHKDNIFKIRKVFHSHPEAKGFGLFMTKTQVEAMGGTIWVESTPDVGSTFFIKFEKINHEKIEIIALIDDDDTYIYISKRMLKQIDAINKIEVFGNGLDGLNYLKLNINNPILLPEIIFLDLSMPIMDGWQFLEEFINLNSSNLKKSLFIFAPLQFLLLILTEQRV